MGWDTLLAVAAAQRRNADTGDPWTAPADGSAPSNCPICFTRLAFSPRGDADCPLGHYTWPA